MRERWPSGSTIPISATRARRIEASAAKLNVGQLVREKYGNDAVLIGFTTHHGTVTAASDWDQPAERKRVRPALAGSYEALFHAARPDRFLLMSNDSDSLEEQLRAHRLERGDRRDLPS